MTCKTGREVVCKLAVSSLTAIALMLGTALPARAQARQSIVDLVVTTSDNNTYGCELTVVTTPSGRANGECIATLTGGNAVAEGTKSQQFAMQWVVMQMGPMTMQMEIPFGTVEVEELPDGSANITYHH